MVSQSVQIDSVIDIQNEFNVERASMGLPPRPVVATEPPRSLVLAFQPRGIGEHALATIVSVFEESQSGSRFWSQLRESHPKLYARCRQAVVQS